MFVGIEFADDVSISERCFKHSCCGTLYAADEFSEGIFLE